MFNLTKNARNIIKLSESISKLVVLQNEIPKHHIKLCLTTNSVNLRKFSTTQEKAECDSAELDYEAICKGDKELEHKLKVILLEAEVMRQEGKSVLATSEMKEEHWLEILKLPTRTARKKYFEFIFKVAKKKINKVAKKEQKRLENEEINYEHKKCEDIEEFAHTYNLQNNNIFLRFFDTTINNMYNNRLIQAIQFGQKLVIDCGYDENMTKRENINCAKQLMLLFAANRFHDDPYDLHFCNMDFKGTMMPYLHKHIPTMLEPWFPMNIHKESYLDKFPKEKLVYLTPHCREEMLEYDHDAVYIVGAIVDKVNSEPLSLAKAKREGIKMAKFPLDRYLNWGQGSGKSLTLNQVVDILNDVKNTGDWDYSLRHVPKRKLAEFSGETEDTNNFIRKERNFEGNNRIRRERSFEGNDRIRRERNFEGKPRWSPSKSVDFKNLKFNNKDKAEAKERLVRVSRLYEE